MDENTRFIERYGLSRDQIEEKANEILSGMTLKDKTGQMSGDTHLLQSTIIIQK